MTTVVVHQPDFAPWLGFFDRLRTADIYIRLDDVQFLRRGWHHRDKILGPSGPTWLTVPVVKKGRYDQQIRDVAIDGESRWKKKHLATLESVYGACPGFVDAMASLRPIYDEDFSRLIDLNNAVIDAVIDLLDIDIEVVDASSLDVKTTSTARLVELVEKVGGNRYLTGQGSRAYLDESLFESRDIAVTWQSFEHPQYDQGRPGFTPMLSVFDSWLRSGDATRELWARDLEEV